MTKNIYKSLVLIDSFKGINLHVYAGPQSSKLPFKYLDHSHMVLTSGPSFSLLSTQHFSGESVQKVLRLEPQMIQIFMKTLQSKYVGLM